MNTQHLGSKDIPAFDRDFLESGEPITRIGNGEIGGKAHGLALANTILKSEISEEQCCDIDISIPQLTVTTTDIFDVFMERNDLLEVALSDLPDERIAHSFQRADLPTEIIGDLKALIDAVHSPLAVRSSSLLEDALFRPFAGVYETKMTPNNNPDPSERFRRLVEAIKFVWSSTYFKAPKNYIRATNKNITDEKMAVIIQQVIGNRHDDRFYPDLSGVCRSYNYYPSARAKPEEGVVNLALGLGKTVVDGGISWAYSPARPKLPPPFASAVDQMKNTQTEFWAVNMGKPSAFDPIAETEYLIASDLSAADYDGSLKYLASTYNAASDRLSPGPYSEGPKVVNFAPLLQLEQFKLNQVVKNILTACEKVLDTAVEIEFAMTFPPKADSEAAQLGFLQVRPMVVSDEQVEITDEDMESDSVLIASNRVMGNGVNETIRDVVYVKPDSFEARYTGIIAGQLEKINTPLLSDNRPYLLIGFGRWGSSDPWLGIPINWGQICGTKVMVEATLPNMNIEPSQGSHFFHNLSSFEVDYFTVSHHAPKGVDWAWLDEQQIISETEFVKHVRLVNPLRVKVDGRTGRGAIYQGHD